MNDIYYDNDGDIYKILFLYGVREKTLFDINSNYINSNYIMCGISMGSHPCVYIGIKKTHPLYRLDEDIGVIDCHGGITYRENGILNVLKRDIYHEGRVFLDKGKYLNTFSLSRRDLKKYFWIGWDYAHFNDYYHSKYRRLSEDYSNVTTPIKWERDDLLKDAHDVIQQLGMMNKLHGYPFF